MSLAIMGRDAAVRETASSARGRTRTRQVRGPSVSLAASKAAAAGLGGTGGILHLQGQAGNAAVTALLRSTQPARAIQRQPDPDKKPAQVRRDVVFMLSPNKNLDAEARVIAPGALVVRAGSLAELVKKAKALSFPIKTAFFMGHSLSSGDIGFETADKTTYELPSKIAEALQGSLPKDRAPEAVDFRGCSVGQSPAGMDAVRKALGAGSATGSTCFLVTVSHGPIAVGGKDITRPDQVTKANRAAFEKGFKMLLDQFGGSRRCILNNSEKGYFEAGGKLVAVWANPDLEEAWDDKLTCYASMAVDKVDPAKRPTIEPGIGEACKLVKVGR